MGTVRFTADTLPPVNKEEWDRVDALKDEEIDCSDIPEFKDLSGFRPWQERKTLKPEKVAVTCNLDADIAAWLTQGGEAGCQTRLNTILRQAMVHAQ